MSDGEKQLTDRRTALQLAGAAATAGIATLAGCSSGDGPSATGDTDGGGTSAPTFRGEFEYLAESDGHVTIILNEFEGLEAPVTLTTRSDNDAVTFEGTLRKEGDEMDAYDLTSGDKIFVEHESQRSPVSTFTYPEF